MYRLRINYYQVISQVREIENQAQALERELTNIENMELEIKSSWQGPASEAFLKQYEVLKTDVRSTLKSMRTLSKTIKDIADRIKREDEAMAEKAAKMSRDNPNIKY